MKNTIKKVLALLLALVMTMLLAGCGTDNTADTASAEATTTDTVPVTETAEADTTNEDAQAEDYAVMTIGGIDVMFSELAQTASLLYSYGYCSSETDYLSALDYILFSDVAYKLLIEGNEQELLGDSYEELKAQYVQEFKDMVQSYADSLVSEGATDEEKATAYQQALAAYAAYGYDEESYAADSISTAAFNAYTDAFEIQPTQEQIEAAFDEEVANEKVYFENDVAMYEYYSMYGYDIWYVPAGYRGILHILLEVDEGLLDAYNNAADDAAKAEAAQALLDSVKDTTDAIYAAFNAGTPFEELIAQYNTDPGMTGDNLTNGYKVHADSITYEQAFTDGAFAEEMTAPGCIGQPVISSYGVHVLYYLNDVPEGACELTQDIIDELTQSIVSNGIVLEVGKRLKAFEIVYSENYSDIIIGNNFIEAAE